MIVILNRQLVMTEMLMWARYKLVQVLQCDLDAVRAEWALRDDRVVPSFSVAQEIVDTVEPETLRELFQSVSAHMRAELAARLAGLTQTRRQTE